MKHSFLKFLLIVLIIITMLGASFYIFTCGTRTSDLSTSDNDSTKVVESTINIDYEVDDDELYEEYMAYLHKFFCIYNDEQIDEMAPSAAFYDINEDGIKEMIVSYGSDNADWSNDIVTYKEGSSYYIDEILGQYVFYQAEDEEGLYLVQGTQGNQTLLHLTMSEDGDEIDTEIISQGPLDEDEEYYSNDYPVEFTDVKELLGIEYDDDYGDNDYGDDYDDDDDYKNEYEGIWVSNPIVQLDKVTAQAINITYYDGDTIEFERYAYVADTSMLGSLDWRVNKELCTENTTGIKKRI